MSRSAQLYRIINGLSRGEKRQFKLQAFKYDKDGGHISSQLFDIFDSMKSWDKEVFQEQLEQVGIQKGAAVHVNNLLSMILDSLRIKESSGSPVFQINKLVEESILLTIRDEFSLAWQRIRKAKKLAGDAELHEKLIEVMMQERMILHGMLKKKEYNEFRTDYYNKLTEVIGRLNNKVEYFNLMEEVFFTFYSIGYPESDKEKSIYAEIMKTPMLQDIAMARSSGAKISFHFIHMLYFQSMHELESARDVALRQTNLYEQNPEFAKTNIGTYVSVLNNLAIIQAHVDTYENFHKTLGKMRNIPKTFSISDKHLDLRIFELSYGAELDYHITRKQFAELTDTIPLIEATINRYCKGGSSFSRFINVAVKVALSHFHTGELEKAHGWTKRILEENETLNTIYNILFSMILDLVLHFIEGDYKFLSYRITSTQKFFRKHNQLVPLNAAFFKLLKQLMKARDLKQVEIVLAGFRESYEAMPESMTKLFYRNYLYIDEILVQKFWMEDKFPN